MKRRPIDILVLILTLMLAGQIFAQARARNPQREQVPRPPRAPELPQREVLYLTPEQEEEALEYVKEHYPERLEELEPLETRKPEKYKAGLSRAYRELTYLERLKENEPERYERVLQEKKLESQARQLAQAFEEADEAKKAEIKTEMKTVLARAFDLRQQNRQYEIQRLEAKLQELKENNQVRLDNKERIIEKRLEEMLGLKDELRW